MNRNALVAGLCLLAYSSITSAETVSLPVTTSHERLIVALWEGDIDVSPGLDGELRMIAICEPREPGAVDRDDGFRSLRASAVLPEIVSSDEVITIRTYEDAPHCSITLTVPERLDLHTRVNFEGSISVDGWSGRLVAWSASGSVTIASHSGSLSVTAMNGDATVSLAQEGINADSAITSANGTLTLTVDPSNIPQMRAQARWGDIQTNLDTTFEEIIEAGGTWFSSARNEAEPVLTMRNLNRDIVIRSLSQ